MSQLPDIPSPHDEGGRLAENVIHFGRLLRDAGLRLGPGDLLRAVEALQAVDITRRDQVYWALHASLISRHDQKELFDQAFALFWRHQRLMDRIMGLTMPQPAEEQGQPPVEQDRSLSRRLAEALSNDADHREREEPEIDLHADMTWSDRDALQSMDFEAMSRDEVAEARRLMGRFTLPLAEVTTRRYRPALTGQRLDMRRTLAAQARSGGDLFLPKRKRRTTRPPPLVTLCDISGSMTRYSRMLLHFLHALTSDRERVFTFLFGTRLTNVTHQLRHRDVDDALQAVADQVEDWSGGTRMASCLHSFNRDWSRRVLSQGAVVLLITDGLDREGDARLAREVERIHKSCRRLIWLNPLLRYDAFEPKSQGAQAILPHVDDFRPVHNLDSLAGLAEALQDVPHRRQEGIQEWLTKLPGRTSPRPST